MNSRIILFKDLGIPQIIFAKTNHQFQKSLLTQSKIAFWKKKSIEEFSDHFLQRVVKRCGVFLLKKFRFAPALKPLNATPKEPWWMFHEIPLLVLIFFQKTFAFTFLRKKAFITN